MKLKRITTTLLLAMSMLVMVAQNLPGINLQVGGTTRNYKEYVPKNLGAKRPLLISCHGMNQDANYQANMLDIKSVADTAKFVTVFPEGIDKGWDISGRRDINFVLALIDEMVKKYDIDPGSVYLSGFSMGGMFTYHAMNIIADRIAAFAPISGYPMGGATAKASVRPIPIIHTHGTGDDVVGYGNVKSNLNVWIQHNGCPTTAKVTKNYRNTPHITRYVWGPGNDGVEVVLMEMADKGHWISNDYGVKTGEEIWNFCKRYRIDVQWPYVKPQVQIGQRFASLDEARSHDFSIVNEQLGKAFYGIDNQNLGFEDYATAFDDSNTGYLFRLEKSGANNGWLLRLITPDGNPYDIWGSPGYLNSQPINNNSWCCFILGLNNQYGQDMRNGAVWDIQYVNGKGFTLKNVGTGKYLRDATPAQYDTPTYFSFCTTEVVNGIESIKSFNTKNSTADRAVYDLQGRRVDGQALLPGIYIRGGKKFVVR